MIAGLGRVKEREELGDGARVLIATALAGELDRGDSVAVDGVCLTAADVGVDAFAADVMNATLRGTALGLLRSDSTVNLELPLRANDRLGGHLVQGHVDGVGAIEAIHDDGFARLVRVEPPPELMRYIVLKGSIAVNGVSLTVAEIDDRSFTVSLIPETLERTNLSALESGARVNLEVDMLAKYVEKAIGR